MTYIHADRHTVTIEIEMDAIAHEMPSDFLIGLVIDRGIETEMLSAIDDETIIDHIFDNNLEKQVIASMDSDDVIADAESRGNFTFDLSTVDDDDLWNELRQRNL